MSSSAPSDVGFFLSSASRYPLLNAARERELATTLWRARRRLFRTFEMARKWRGRVPLAIPASRDYKNRRISPEVRRRLIATEDYSERLILLMDGERNAGNFDRSLSLTPPPHPRQGRGLRHLSSWTPPSLTGKQVGAIAPVLREELGKIRAVREELVQHNLRLVIWVAKSYRGRGMDLVDLIQEGSMGLLRAIDRFDPAVGTRFSTFATHWIRQGIGRSLAEKARMIRIPLNRLPEVRETTATQTELGEKLNRPPTLEELAERMKAEPGKIHELLPALTPVDSIDAPLASGDIRFADTLADKKIVSPLERAMEEETSQSVQKLLERMPARHRVILAMRYGIGYPRECSLEEIGRALGLSRERIRQIEKTARKQFETGWVRIAPRTG
jgi:RNA polymerase sigma factor (sigma-70 family)